METNRIVPHLWFNTEATEAAAFYASVFPDSRITSRTTLRDTPSISFILNFDPSRDENAKKSLDAMWQLLSEGGTPLMPLDRYPFSERYGWVADRYGVSWQLLQRSRPKG